MKLLDLLKKNSYSKLLTSEQVGLINGDIVHKEDDLGDARRLTQWNTARTLSIAHLVFTLALVTTLLVFYAQRGPNNPIFKQITYCSLFSKPIVSRKLTATNSPGPGRSAI